MFENAIEVLGSAVEVSEMSVVRVWFESVYVMADIAIEGTKVGVVVVEIARFSFVNAIAVETNGFGVFLIFEVDVAEVEVEIEVDRFEVIEITEFNVGAVTVGVEGCIV
jgi:hypothetical protein